MTGGDQKSRHPIRRILKAGSAGVRGIQGALPRFSYHDPLWQNGVYKLRIGGGWSAAAGEVVEKEAKAGDHEQPIPGSKDRLGRCETCWAMSHC
jgi:hypothetical protein